MTFGHASTNSRSHEPTPGGFQDLCNRETAQARHRFLEMAGRGLAGAAGDIQAQNGFRLTVWTGMRRIGGSEQSHERCSQSGGDMHGAGIVGYEEGAAF